MLETPPTILKEDVIFEESESEAEMSSFSYDGTPHLTSFSAISGQASAPPGPSTSASALLPKSAPTLLRDFDPILDELKAENNCNFEANQRLSGNNVTTIENVYSGVPLLQDSNIACCSSSTTATPSPEPPSEPPPPLPQSGMYSGTFDHNSFQISKILY